MKKQTLESVVYVIDDDASVRDSLRSLFGSVGLHVELFDLPTTFCKVSIRTSLAAWYSMFGCPASVDLSSKANWQRREGICPLSS